MEENIWVSNMQQEFFGEDFRGVTLAKARIQSARGSEQISEWVAKPRKFLVILGGPGTGKTFLCAGIFAALSDKFRWIRCYEESELLKRVRQSIGNTYQGDYVTFLENLIDDDLIIIDDLGSTGVTEWRQEIIFETINYRYKSGKPTVVTSNLDQIEITKAYGERVSSRLFGSKNTIVTLFESPDLRKHGF